MARTKTQSHRSRSTLEREGYTADLSTGQLVLGACLLLGFGLGCFLLGILIGKFDPSLHDRVAQTGPEMTVPPPPANTVPLASPVTRPDSESGVSALPPETRAPRIVQPAPQQAGASLPEPVQQQPPPKPEPQAATPAAAPEPAQPKSTVSVSPPEVSVTLPQTGGAAQSGPEDAAAAPVAESPKSAAASSPPQPPPLVPAPQPAVSAPAATTEVVYAVQIFAGARWRADNVKRDIEARSKYRGEVIAISGDALCKVVIGQFNDKGAAERARDEFRTTYKFPDAFVILRQ